MKNELKSSTTTTTPATKKQNEATPKSLNSFRSFLCTYQLLTFSPNGKIRKTKTRQILVLVKKKSF